MITRGRIASGVVAVSAIAFLAGCGANVVFGEDGSGAAGNGGNGSGGRPIPPDGPGSGAGPGSGGAPGPGPGSGGSSMDSMRDQMDSMDINPVTTSGPTMFCDDIGNCQGNGGDPESGCVECAIVGDSSIAIDGGACSDSYFACFGFNGDCSDGLPDCCEAYDCLVVCSDLPTTEEYLDCICTNDGMACLGFDQQLPGTCFGDHVRGMQSYSAFATCVLDEVCTISCQ